MFKKSLSRFLESIHMIKSVAELKLVDDKTGIGANVFCYKKIVDIELVDS